ncbi:unnamed protein product [Litomosoides sigmodontis]|uniref:ZP domain-containing protein n=1 Tax=Litomosoides sigmodontis TaxID=42156 RepID=A0A3P6V810_LITSI|nr:unnamed protein product [Litomosoides sigmodontis]
MLLRYSFSNLLCSLWFVLHDSSEASSTLDADNGLIGVPEIRCNPDTIELAFRTKREFRGKVFVKGHYSNPNCRIDYGKAILDSKNPAGGITLSHGQCDMNRQRLLFITKLDRAFHIRCMYREIVQPVSSGIEHEMIEILFYNNPLTALLYSALATQAVEYDYPFPNCIYTIRKDEIDGPILKYARVDAYGLLVHNCYVEDGQGEKQIIIDENGCHTDRTVLGDPTYVESLNMAYRESLVFKFADRVIVRFQCQIRLCIKDTGACAGITPPMCSDEKEQRNEKFATTTTASGSIVDRATNVTKLALLRRSFLTGRMSGSDLVVMKANDRLSETQAA